MPLIRTLVPASATRLIEPFVGSGAVALNLSLPGNLLADANPDVVAVYDSLSNFPGRFVRDTKKLFVPANNSALAFSRLRTEFNECQDRYRRACLFIYLNRHGYNGLCRYNRSGGFNVPFGRYEAPYFPQKEMSAFRSFLRKAVVRCADFREVIHEAGPGDFVYCDPPYSPMSETANFTGYARGGFSHQDQLDLVSVCRAAATRGAVVVVSNHDTPTTRALYEAADQIIELQVSRVISCNGAKRAPAAELLVVYAAIGLAIAQ